jgi:hypothetical protein
MIFMADPIHLLLMSNHDLQASLILAGRHLCKRKYDAKASQIVRVLRESLRTARRAAQMAEAERIRAQKKTNASKASVAGRTHIISEQGADAGRY